ncbi:MAG: FAD-binding oxidoreductase [Gammaproteobacteria bacterium]|nr:FAD-binding oxidoreductase [Gammaproteobacteria bacterium]MDH5801286.1 FAD-binding oxidoreductase [Gammaproteobacteria bacterium]
MEIPQIEIGDIPLCPVADDALQGIPRQQTNASRWNGASWQAFLGQLVQAQIEVEQNPEGLGVYVTDASGIAYGKPHGVVLAHSADQIAQILKAAQIHGVPVTVRGGGLTTEGESVAYGGLLLDMTGMSRVLHIDTQAQTVRTQAGIYWHTLAESLRRQNMDYLSAPLNMTSSVGGTLGVGGIDVNSARLGCSADQVESLQVVTPTGDIAECSDSQNPELFQRVILGYGQFGVITEATLRIRPYTPLRMHYFYYRDLRTAIEDLQQVDRDGVCDYTGILTMMDKAITLLVAFDSDEKQQVFEQTYRSRLRGYGELMFGLRLSAYYTLRPWRFREALYLLQRKRTLFPDLQPKHHMRNGTMLDRTVVFSRAVWTHWGGRQMVIPDLATSTEKFVDAVLRGNAVCKKYFPFYTLYCVGIKLRDDHKAHYELSSIPPDAQGWAYGCEFEPMLHDDIYSRDTLQSFKNEIYDIGVEMKTSYYRFGGMMKGYIRRALGDAVVERHLQMKREADPAMILNRDVIF